MKKIILILTFLFFGLKTIAFDFSSVSPTGQTLYYNINNQTKTVIVTAPYYTKVRSSYIGYSKPSGDLIIPNTVNYNGIEYTVIAIDNQAFSSCADLKSVIILDSIRIIGSESFANCSNLKSVKLGESVRKIGASAFLSCSKLKHINLPNTLVEISKHAFAHCSSLEEVIIPNNIRNIEAYTFSSCKNLRQITLSESIEYIGESAFSSCSNLNSITLPQNLKIIDNKAFSSCSKLQTIKLPESITSLGLSVFSSCVSLKTINFPQSLRVISNSTFAHCESLESIEIPNTIEIIDNNAFEYCTKLTHIILPTTISVIGNAVFSNCVNLAEINVPKSVVTIGSYAFQNCKNLKTIDLNSVHEINKYAFEGCESLELVILSNTREIGSYAFSECKKLKSIEIPNTIDTVRSYVFYNCTNLERVKIGDNVRAIGNYAFYKCSKLNSLNIPAAVTMIGVGAFEQCLNITSITFGENIETISAYAFNNCKNLREIVFKTTTPPLVTSKTTWNGLPKNANIYIDLNDSIINPDSVFIASLRFPYLEAKVHQSVKNLEVTIDSQRQSLIKDRTIYENFNKTNIQESLLENIPIAKLYEVPVKRKVLYLEYPQTISVLSLSLNGINTEYLSYIEPTQENIVTNTILEPQIIQMTPIQPTSIKEESIVEKKDCLLTVFSYDDIMGETKGSGKYSYSKDIEISAKANIGYKFVSWHDNNVDNPRTINLVNDTAFCAIFEPETYIIDVNTNDIMMGDAYGSGVYNYNSEVIITADAFEGYKFVKWNDGSTENPRKIKVNDTEKIYIAIFSPNNNLGLEEKLTFYPNPTKGVVYLSKKAKIIEVFNTSGNLVDIFAEKSVVDISSLPSGTYTFRVTINEGIQTLKVIKK
ncbi:MAG: leucine-rich repeat domain-containing protein [Bacteroidales bacterium]|nr:leucine-rich repeat domain-containing protein [Bacteroidales bacterium]